MHHIFVYPFFCWRMHLGCFHFLIVMNNAAMKINIWVLYKHVSISLGLIPRNKIVGLYDVYVFTFEKLPVFQKQLHHLYSHQHLDILFNFKIFLYSCVCYNIGLDTGLWDYLKKYLRVFLMYLFHHPASCFRIRSLLLRT